MDASSNRVCDACGLPSRQHTFGFCPDGGKFRLDATRNRVAGIPIVTDESVEPGTLELRATRNRAQAQDSLQDQLLRVYGMALWHGEYDAADWIKERMT